MEAGVGQSLDWAQDLDRYSFDKSVHLVIGLILYGDSFPRLTAQPSVLSSCSHPAPRV